jgi:hypothetical protein
MPSQQVSVWAEADAPGMVQPVRHVHHCHTPKFKLRNVTKVHKILVPFLNRLKICVCILEED